MLRILRWRPKNFDLMYAVCLVLHSVGRACEHVFTSAKGPTGTFSSPGYPEPYTTYVACRYIFKGTPDERIKISFDDFDLEPGTSAGLATVFVFIGGYLYRS